MASPFSASLLACLPRELIITADDLGYSSERDAGIFLSFQSGVLTQASLMVNGSTACAAAREAGRLGLPLGLHANLTEGSPVSPPDCVSCLLSASPDALGRRVFLGKRGLREACEAAALDAAKGGALAEAAEAEVRAQLARFVELVRGADGEDTDEEERADTSAIGYVDGHQHVHTLPLLAPSFARAMSAWGVRRTRFPTERVTCFPHTPKPTQEFYEEVAAHAEAARRVYERRGVAGADHFVGMSLTGGVGSGPDGVAQLRHALHLGAPLQRLPTNTTHAATARPTTVELMVHPGYATPSAEALRYPGGAPVPTTRATALVTKDGLPDDFSKSADRERELDLLTRPETRVAIEELGFKLVSSETSEGLARAVQELESNTDQLQATEKPLDVLLLASLSPSTGNYHTAMRLMRLLAHVPRVRHVRAMWPAHATEPLVHAAVARLGVGLVVGLHAYRAGRLLRSCKVPVVLVLGGTDVMAMATMGGPEGEQGAVMLQAALKARRLVAFSKEMVGGLARLEGCGGEQQKQRIVPAIIPQAALLPEAVCAAANEGGWSLRSRLGLRPGDWLLLLPLGLRRVKDPLFLLDAAAAWHAEDSRAHLLLVGPALEPACSAATLAHLGLLTGGSGDGEAGAEVLALPSEEESAALLRATGVSYLAPLSRERLLLSMREADAVVNSSVSEGMSNALLEAMAVGTPLLVRRNAGNESLVKGGETGLLFDSAEEFVHQARRLLGGAAAGELGLAARLVAGAGAFVIEKHGVEAELRAYTELVGSIVPATKE